MTRGGISGPRLSRNKPPQSEETVSKLLKAVVELTMSAMFLFGGMVAMCGGCGRYLTETYVVCPSKYPHELPNGWCCDTSWEWCLDEGGHVKGAP